MSRAGDENHEHDFEAKDHYHASGTGGMGARHVRGKGLMIGFEFIKVQTKAPATEERRKSVWEAVEKGFLILATGPSSLRLTLPVMVSRGQAEVGLQVLEDVIDCVEAEVWR